MDSANYLLEGFKEVIMSKNGKNSTNEEKGMLQKDDDLRKKGKVDHSVTPPWPVNPKGKSGVPDRGHRNRP